MQGWVRAELCSTTFSLGLHQCGQPGHWWWNPAFLGSLRGFMPALVGLWWGSAPAFNVFSFCTAPLGNSSAFSEQEWRIKLSGVGLCWIMCPVMLRGNPPLVSRTTAWGPSFSSLSFRSLPRGSYHWNISMTWGWCSKEGSLTGKKTNPERFPGSFLL